MWWSTAPGLEGKIKQVQDVFEDASDADATALLKEHKYDVSTAILFASENGGVPVANPAPEEADMEPSGAKKRKLFDIFKRDKMSRKQWAGPSRSPWHNWPLSVMRP